MPPWSLCEWSTTASWTASLWLWLERRRLLVCSRVANGLQGSERFASCVAMSGTTWSTTSGFSGFSRALNSSTSERDEDELRRRSALMQGGAHRSQLSPSPASAEGRHFGLTSSSRRIRSCAPEDTEGGNVTVADAFRILSTSFAALWQKFRKGLQ